MSRKYGQRGYQEDDRETPEKRSPSKPRPSGESRHSPLKPRGRGLGKPTATVFRCAVCGHQQSVTFGEDSVCGQCGTDLHTCTHCTFFDTSATFECRKPITEPVMSKAKRNQCELFEPKATQEFAKEEGPGPTKGKAAFDALFKI